MVDRKRNRWLALLKNALFRVAFGGFIVLELVLFALLLLGVSWAISASFKVAPEENAFFLGSLIVLTLIGPFAIGAFSYLIFQRLTRTQYVLTESERWLAERHEADPRQIKLRNRLRRCAICIPAVSVILLCVFMDEAWALASHVFNPGSGNLVSYRVSIPLRWSIAYSQKNTSPAGSSSILVAARYRGLIRAGSALYVAGRPPFTASLMNFRNTPSGEAPAAMPGSTVMSTRSLAFGKDRLTCWEEAPPVWMTAERYIHCSTSTGDFSGNFNGSDEDAAEFYRVVQSAKHIE